MTDTGCLSSRNLLRRRWRDTRVAYCDREFLGGIGGVGCTRGLGRGLRRRYLWVLISYEVGDIDVDKHGRKQN